jgi:DNA repair exonuclease SbcCD ATPase subunit
VILALYAPSNHNRGTLKDYINTGCDKGKITLDFTSDGVTYRVYRELRRNSSSLAKLYNLDTGEVLADKADTTTDAVKKMLKLDKDDFTKVVVLEQGKYAEFMSMGKAKRYETVAKLFNLERFDVLKDKVAEAKRRYEGEADNIRAALAEYEDVTEAALAAQKKEKKRFRKKGSFRRMPGTCLWRDGRRGIQRSSLPKRQGIKSGKSCA